MKPDLQKLLASWQEKLRLRDWRIAISYVPDLASRDGSAVYGLCTPFVDGKEARIQIRDPELSRPLGGDEMPVEETLVHELLHLHFAPLAENTAAGIAAEEQAVWAITEAMTSTKDVAQQARMARAFVSVASRKRTERKSQMDPKAILAMIKMALSTDDPAKALEALVAELEGTSGAPATDPAVTPAEQGTAPAEEPKAAEAKPEEPKEQRVAARAAAAPLRATIPASSLVTRAQMTGLEDRIERAETERLLDKRPDVNAAQRAFALGLKSSVKAEEYLKSLGAQPEASPPAVRAQRGTAPTQGAKGGGGRGTQDGAIDRAMGIRPPAAQAIGRDPVSGRLTISNIAATPVVRGEKGGPS